MSNIENIIGRGSELSIENNKQVLRPVWTYGIQLWGCSKKSNLEIIQVFQNKVLRGIVNAPWYVRNVDLHRDLRIDFVKEAVKKHALSHNARLQQHCNEEMEIVLDVSNNIRRLKQMKPHELMA